MTELIRKTGKFYSSIIIKNIILFLAFGILSVLFSESGWIPNSEIYDIALIIYQVMIPLVIGYTAGNKIGGEIGGLAGILASAGIILEQDASSVMGVMLVAPFAGFLAKKAYDLIRDKSLAGFEMLTKNLVIGSIGCMCAIFSYFIVGTALGAVNHVVYRFVDFMIHNQMLPFVSFFIEPGKVFFLNNGINHGILIPIGMEQIQAQGKSILFLLETNPGPGLGLLMAYYFVRKEERQTFTSCLVIHTFGGIHEVYFPYVLMNLKLLIAVIAGGVSGVLTFLLMDVGLVGPVSPGSIFTILIMSGRNSILGILLGIFISAFVSGMISFFILTFMSKKETDISTDESDEKIKMNKQTLNHIYFVCDAGVGSSAMGAALLRRECRKFNITDIHIAPSSIDEIPGDADLIVCQKNFEEKLHLPDTVKVYTVEEQLNMNEYTALLNRLKKLPE